MLDLLEKTRSQNLQIENNLKEKFQEDTQNKDQQIHQLTSQLDYLQQQIQVF